MNASGKHHVLNWFNELKVDLINWVRRFVQLSLLKNLDNNIVSLDTVLYVVVVEYVRFIYESDIDFIKLLNNLIYN